MIRTKFGKQKKHGRKRKNQKAWITFEYPIWLPYAYYEIYRTMKIRGISDTSIFNSVEHYQYEW